MSFPCANRQAPLCRVSLAAPGPQTESHLSPARHAFPLRMRTLAATPLRAVMLWAPSLPRAKNNNGSQSHSQPLLSVLGNHGPHTLLTNSFRPCWPGGGPVGDSGWGVKGDAGFPLCSGLSPGLFSAPSLAPTPGGVPACLSPHSRASLLYRGACTWPPISLQPWEAAPSRCCPPELFWLLSSLS